MGFNYRISTGLGKQTLRGHKQNPGCTRSQEKGTASPQETEPDFLVCAWESLVEVWVESGLLQGRGTADSSPGRRSMLAYILLGEVTDRKSVV